MHFFAAVVMYFICDLVSMTRSRSAVFNLFCVRYQFKIQREHSSQQCLQVHLFFCPETSDIHQTKRKKKQQQNRGTRIWLSKLKIVVSRRPMQID